MRLNKSHCVSFVLGVLVFGTSALFAQQQLPRWRRGQFHELVAGRSTRKDVLRLLGATAPKKGARLETYQYSGKADFPGDLIVEVNRATGVVETITERFSPNITRTQARKTFGDDYIEVPYSTVQCRHEGVNPLAYRDPNGPIGLIVYPQKGLVLWPNSEGFDIAAALYLAKPLPSKKPRCSP